MFGARFPTILDDYVLRDFVIYLFLVLGAFLMLFLVFTVFDLLETSCATRFHRW